MLAILILTSLLLVALAYDLSSHRIPNILNLIGLILGFSLQIALLGYSGILYGLQGLIVGFFILFPMYFVGASGAGDVKFMSVIGVFLGHWQNVLVAGCATIVAGGVYGMLYLLLGKDVKIAMSRYCNMFRCLATTGRVAYVAPAPNETAAKRFPYATAIVSGTLIAMYLIMNCSYAQKGIFA